MSQSPKRTSDSTGDSAAKTTNPSDIHRAVSKSDITEISPHILDMIADFGPAILLTLSQVDRTLETAKALDLKIRKSDNPGSDTIRKNNDALRALKVSGKAFDQALGMDKDKWIKLAELLGVE
jgi:hypothetical protein